MRCSECICDGEIWCYERELEGIWLKTKSAHRVKLIMWVKAIKAEQAQREDFYEKWGRETGNDVYDVPSRIWKSL